MSEPPVNDLLRVAQAITIIDSAKVAPRVVEVSIAVCTGLILADNLCADRDFPPFDKSQMDGYAVRSSDVRAEATLHVVGEIAAGAMASQVVAAGEAVAIMTGAPMPAGADAVVPVEDVTVRGDSIALSKPTSPGKFIARQASDCPVGTVVLTAGTRLGPAQIAVAAAIGATRVRVFVRPRVAVLSTGDEIVDIDQTPGPTQIRNSNSTMLVSLLQRLGCETVDLGHVPDEPARLRTAISTGLQHDALFITGGMSMGKYDYVPGLLRELGVQLLITKLRIKPGKPFVFGSLTKARSPNATAYVFGLPGNPVSAFVCTLRLASRLLTRMAGGAMAERWITARLDSPLPANGPREFYQPAKLIGDTATPMNWKGSADLFTLAHANALLVRAENEPALPAGSLVRLLEIPQ